MSRSLLIYFVDDDPFSTRFMMRKLADCDGLEFRWFESTDAVEDALARCSGADMPRLVLVDLKKSHRANEDFVLGTAQLLRSAGIALVVMLGRVTDELELELQEAGATSLLERGAPRVEIEAGLREALIRTNGMGSNPPASA